MFLCCWKIKIICIWFENNFWAIYSQCDQIWLVFDGLRDRSSPSICQLFSPLLKMSLLNSNMLCLFLCNFWIRLGYFYSTIWSHCLQQKTLFSLSWHFKSKNDLISFSKKSFLIVIAVFIQHNRFWWTQTSRRAKWHKMLMPLTRTLVSFHERLKFGCFLKIK